MVKPIIFNSLCITHLGVHEAEKNHSSAAELSKRSRGLSSPPESSNCRMSKLMITSRKILFLAANPTNTTRLRLGKEAQEIEESLRLSTKRDQFFLTQKHAVRLKDVYRALLNERPNIVHFSGHGDQDGLALEDDAGRIHLIEGETLSNLFGQFSSIECVLLNACYSHAQAEGIAQHVPYVIGMKREIDDGIAINFAARFYDALGNGQPVQKSYKLAIAATELTPITVSRDILTHPDSVLQLKPEKNTPILVVGNLDKTVKKVLTPPPATYPKGPQQADNRRSKSRKIPLPLLVSFLLLSSLTGGAIALFSDHIPRLGDILSVFKFCPVTEAIVFEDSPPSEVTDVLKLTVEEVERCKSGVLRIHLRADNLTEQDFNLHPNLNGFYVRDNSGQVYEQHFSPRTEDTWRGIVPPLGARGYITLDKPINPEATSISVNFSRISESPPFGGPSISKISVEDIPIN